MAPVQSKPVHVNGADKVSFLDLPPEIRNAVYELCLIQPEAKSLAMASLRPGLARFGLAERAGPVSWQPQLLLVCRQVYQEAMPVLYGNTLFIAHGRHEPFAVKSSERLKEAVKHIRRVSINKQENQVQYFRLLQELISMPNLTEVQIRCGFRVNFRTPKTMSKALLPLLKKLNSQSENAQGSHGVEKIEFVVANRWWHRYITQSFADEVKDFLRASLT